MIAVHTVIWPFKLSDVCYYCGIPVTPTLNSLLITAVRGFVCVCVCVRVCVSVRVGTCAHVRVLHA